MKSFNIFSIFNLLSFYWVLFIIIPYHYMNVFIFDMRSITTGVSSQMTLIICYSSLQQGKKCLSWPQNGHKNWSCLQNYLNLSVLFHKIMHFPAYIIKPTCVPCAMSLLLVSMINSLGKQSIPCFQIACKFSRNTISSSDYHDN